MSDQYGPPQQGHPVQPVYAQPQPPYGYPAEPPHGYPAQPPQGYPAQPPQGYPAQPYGYPAQQYGYPAPYTPPVPRPALTREQRVGAMLAGGIGFTMFSLGAGAAFSIAILALVAGILAVVFGWFIASSTNEGDYAEFQNLLDSFPVEVVVPVGIVAFILAIALMIGGILVSIRILKKRGVNKGGAVTWSGLGIGIVAYWITSSIVGVAPSLLSSVADGAFEVIVVVFTVVIAVALPIVIGVFTWWWMAHTMRAPAAG